MDHRIATPVAGSNIGIPRNSRELVESIYNELDVPTSKREKHYSAVVHWVRQFCQFKYGSLAAIPPDPRTQSQCSTRSTTSSSLSFRTDTEPSLQSSRTSHCSSVSRESLQATVGLSANHHEFTTAASSSFVRIEPAPASNPLDSLHRRRVSGNPTGHCCPWCNKSVARLHDFKRHVKDYCCGRRLWICRNPSCSHSTYQEKQANEHRYQGGDQQCRRHGWLTIDLKCDRKHFGCSYCATYFDNLDKFLRHFGKQCGPGKARSGCHSSSQIAALLQQPLIRPLAEALSLELRGATEAYTRLHWCWKPHYVAKIIEQLEYGPKARVDVRNPGIANDQLDNFLRLLITPSAGSRDVVEFAIEHARSNSLRKSACKPLPSLPEFDGVPNPETPQQQVHSEVHVGNIQFLETPAINVHSAFGPVTASSSSTPEHDQSPDNIGIAVTTFEEVSYPSEARSDTYNRGVTEFLEDDFGFTWEHLSATIRSDSLSREAWSFDADLTDQFTSYDIDLDLPMAAVAEETSTSQPAPEFLQFDRITCLDSEE